MSYLITPFDYATNNVQAAIADQIMAKANVDKDDVAQIVVGNSTATLTLYLRDQSGRHFATGQDIATQTVTVVWP